VRVPLSSAGASAFFLPGPGGSVVLFLTSSPPAFSPGIYLVLSPGGWRVGRPTFSGGELVRLGLSGDAVGAGEALLVCEGFAGEPLPDLLPWILRAEGEGFADSLAVMES